MARWSFRLLTNAKGNKPKPNAKSATTAKRDGGNGGGGGGGDN